MAENSYSPSCITYTNPPKLLSILENYTLPRRIKEILKLDRNMRHPDYIRLLVLLPNGDRLINVKAPKEDCNLKDLLVQAGVDLTAEATIAVKEMKNEGIEFLVALNFSVSNTEMNSSDSIGNNTTTELDDSIPNESVSFKLTRKHALMYLGSKHTAKPQRKEINDLNSNKFKVSRNFSISNTEMDSSDSTGNNTTMKLDDSIPNESSSLKLTRKHALMYLRSKHTAKPQRKEINDLNSNKFKVSRNFSISNIEMDSSDSTGNNTTMKLDDSMPNESSSLKLTRKHALKYLRSKHTAKPQRKEINDLNSKKI